jgi:hypothetical protein
MATEKAPGREGPAKQTPAEAGCVHLETTLMNSDYWGAVNFFAVIIGH